MSRCSATTNSFNDEDPMSSPAVNMSTASLSSSACSSGRVGSPSPSFVALRPPLIKLSKKRSRLSLDSNTDDNDSDEGEAISRKLKSLGLLCQRFLLAMGEQSKTNNNVHLDTVAKAMTVEKRRIYDIVNVMEALEAMSKTNKSFYRWHGLDNLPQLMASLQHQALAEGLLDRVSRVEQAMCTFTEISPGAKSGADIVGSLVSNHKINDSGYEGGGGLSLPGGFEEIKPRVMHVNSMSAVDQLHGGCNANTGNMNRGTHQHHVTHRDRNAKNSLAQLCRRFLMVLLCKPRDRRRVSLDVASTVLIKDPNNDNFEPPSRSRCRRLYDIANVLVAMGIIEKVHYLFGTKKIPLFVYCGPEPDVNGSFDMAQCISRLLAQQTSPVPTFLGVNMSNMTGDEPSIKKRTPTVFRRATSVVLPPQRTTPMTRPRSGFDVLVAASESERERLKAAGNIVNDENAPPCSVGSDTGFPQTTPFVRTPSGLSIARPKAQFARTSSFNISTINCPQQPLSGARKFMMKALENNNIYDPSQPHAFQRIGDNNNRGTMHHTPSKQQRSLDQFSVSMRPAPTKLSSSYSVTALLATANSHRASNVHYNIASPTDPIKSPLSGRMRMALGELPPAMVQRSHNTQPRF